IFGMVGCLIPAWLVYKVPALHKYKGASLYLIIITGLLLCVSPTKDKYIVRDDTTRDTLWWSDKGKGKNDNKPLSQETWQHLKGLV
ncbi:hypothetical protein MJN85_28605, partial [Salmonella enterica subsp. enterica serovar Anatum]|nr:hypothetical protein [Salmonella enterica subsp. enterica serovar Anatum]